MSLGYEQGSGVSRNEKLGHSAVGGQVGVLSGGLGFELHEALLCSCPQPRVGGEVNTVRLVTVDSTHHSSAHLEKH